jgi:hypothetical protein
MIPLINQLSEQSWNKYEKKTKRKYSIGDRLHGSEL